MGQSVKTQIIEFNGLAGGGKTTLARELKKELVKRGYHVVLLGEAYHIFKKHLFKNVLSCLSLALLFKYIKLFFLIGRKEEPQFYFYVRYLYWAALRISLLYRWARNSDFDFLLCDHGLIQNIISLLGFKELPDCAAVKQSLASILKAESGIYVVNCNVSIEQSKQRIRSRNKHTGRLDVISDEAELEKLLQITAKHFSAVRNIVKKVREEWPLIDLDMDTPIDINRQKILIWLAAGTADNEY